MAGSIKNIACEEFNKEYLALSDTKKDNFSRLINKLLNENFIYSPDSDSKDRTDYYDILSMKSIIENYFKMIDFDLIHVDTYKIFYIRTNADRNRIRLKKLDTVILLILRLLYHKINLSINLSKDIRTTLGELIQEINKTGIFKVNLNKTELITSLKTLKRYKLINFNFNDLNEDNVIFIYPTILYVVTIDDIDLLNEKIKKYSILKEDEENEISEDQID